MGNYFTNPSKLSYDMALSNTWAAAFDDDKFNILETVGGGKIFPLSDIVFKEMTLPNAPLTVGIGGVLDLSTPTTVLRTTQVTLNFIDNDKQDINEAIREWIKSSPVYTTGRSLFLTKPSKHTKILTLYKLKKDGTFSSGDPKQVFTVFPSEELVQTFNSENAFRVDNLTLRCY